MAFQIRPNKKKAKIRRKYRGTMFSHLPQSIPHAHFLLELPARLWYIIIIEGNRPQGGLTRYKAEKPLRYSAKVLGWFSM